jgi:hypothetical protein
MTPEQEKFDHIVKLLTLLAGTVSFVAIAIKKKGDLGKVWAGALAGAGVITGLAVVTCAFVDSLLPALADMPLYLGITGLSLVLLSGLEIRNAWIEKEKTPDNVQVQVQDPKLKR